MSLRDRWQAIAARIEGIAEAGRLQAAYSAVNSPDPHGVAKELGAQCLLTLIALKQFADDYVDTLPQAARVAIGDFVVRRRPLFEQDASKPHRSQASIVYLKALQSEIAFLLTDHQDRIRSRTERALSHLQRILAVDDAARQLWSTAFATGGETACEALGSTHLLWHGIAAFKVNAQGARTDLVFNEPPDEMIASGSAEGLVLTEWKLATPTNAQNQFAAAREQAELYSQGALSGLELKRFRYLIAVSDLALPRDKIPPDTEIGQIIYRHKNLVVSPKTPSTQAKLDARRK